MAGRDITIPFGPDKTGGLGFKTPESEDGARDPFAEPTDAAVAALDNDRPSVPTIEPVGETGAFPDVKPMDVTTDVAAAASPEAGADLAAVEKLSKGDPAPEANYHPRGMTDEEATEQGVDAFQMSVLALKDSIGQGRELKEREKELEELREALRADHVELTDRENILANYQQIVAEQDAIIEQSTQQREAAKAEAARVAAESEQLQAQLTEKREDYAVQMQPLDAELGRVRAEADQAKNDERSRKSELNAAESELRRADDASANTMAVARHERAAAAYEAARARSEQAKEQLAQVEKINDEAQAQIKQDLGPLERQLEDLKHEAESLKERVNKLGEDISAARKRRQYCDSVYQYPEETAKMRSEIEQAEALSRRMNSENRALRQQFEASRKLARKAKIAIGVVIAIIIIFIICFVVLSGR